MQEEITSFLFPNPLFFQSLNTFRRCWSSFLGFRFAHCQQDMSKLLDSVEKLLFSKSLGIVSAFEGWIIWGDYHGISDGIRWKGSPRCGGRCHSHAYPSGLNGDTFQTFPGGIKFLGLLYRRSTSLWSMLALIQSSGPERTMRMDGPTPSVAGTMVQTHMDTRLFPTWKGEGKWDGVCGGEKGYGAVKCSVPGRGRARIQKVILSKGRGTAGNMPPPLLFLWSTPGVRMLALMTQ